MRTKTAQTRVVVPDAVYNSKTVTKLINNVMMAGKKTIAQRLVYGAMDILKEKTNQPPLEVFETAMANITPKMEVRSRRVGGAAYQVPMPVRPNRAQALAIRWLIAESHKRPSKEFHTFSEKLAAEIIDATQNLGGSVQKKLTTHKMAEANKAFAHFRW